jgi:hypothetical protein
MTVEISLIGLILLHFCTCLQAITCILGFFVVHLVDISVITDRQFLISDRFHNFQRLAMWDEIFGYILAFTIYIYIIKLLHMFRFNRRMSMLAGVIRNSAGELTAFSFALHFCTCLQAITCILGFFVVHLVDISVITDRHCFNFLFKNNKS